MLLIIDNTLTDASPMFLPLLLEILEYNNVPYKLVTSLEQLKAISKQNVKGVIISGSPLMITNDFIHQHRETFLLNMYALTTFNVPKLGICFGCQFINAIYGNGTLSKLTRPYCKVKEVLFKKKKINAKFCCSYILNDISDGFEPVGYTKFNNKNVVCALYNKSEDIMGTLFHPEFEPSTWFIIKDFCKKVKKMQVQP
jgi:GMP synthase-like glutamine amidotransferase